MKQYDKDYMKMAILKQEETFRQQVHELHRLYRVQTLLMNDMKAELQRQRPSNRVDGWNSENETDSCYNHKNQRRSPQVLDLELPAKEYIGKNAMQEPDEESELELTLATGSRRQRKKDNSFTSDSGASFSSSSTTESGGVKLNGGEWGLVRMPNINLSSYRNEIIKSKFNGEEPMNDEKVKRPPWLLQCLSLNMT